MMPELPRSVTQALRNPCNNKRPPVPPEMVEAATRAICAGVDRRRAHMSDALRQLADEEARDSMRKRKPMDEAPSVDAMKRIGQYIKKVRLERNLTQRAVGKAAGCAGHSIGNIECGRDCGIRGLIRVCRFLEIDPRDLPWGGKV
jgi:DNA-binding XRE family transcriptional regulator